MHPNTNLASPQKSSTKNRFIWFVIFIIFSFAAFTAVWFWAANKVDETINQFSAQLGTQGSVLKCENQEVRGYPFRLGLFCSDIVFSDPVRAINVNVRNLRSAAQLYKPGHFIAELDSPLKLSIPNLAPLIIDWQEFRSSVNLTTTGYKRISLVSKNIEIAANDAGLKSPLGTIKVLQIHSRPTPDRQAQKSLDFSLVLTDWEIANGTGSAFEPLLVAINISMDQAQYIIETQQDFIQFLKSNGGTGNIINITLATKSGGEVILSGPINISQNGLVSGEITLDLKDPQKLVNYAGNIFPPIKAALEQGMPFLEGFADRSSGNVIIKDLKLTLKNGDIFLGFFKIGEIPKLF